MDLESKRIKRDSSTTCKPFALHDTRDSTCSSVLGRKAPDDCLYNRPSRLSPEDDPGTDSLGDQGSEPCRRTVVEWVDIVNGMVDAEGYGAELGW